jgi:hypothetical protein|tara:strand:- start:135 stop:341 length:207 start_codon:yes stop_codon:yes gene_type:complete
MTDVLLLDGTIVDNYSKEYMLYCEAKWLLSKELSYRREWLDKVQEKRSSDIDLLKNYISIIFNANMNK